MSVEAAVAAAPVTAPAGGHISIWAICLGALALCAAYQSLFYWISMRLKSDEFTDFGGVSNFLLLALISFIVGEAYESIHKSLVMLYVIIWGSRLVSFLYIRIQRWGGHDRRLEKLKITPNGAIKFWVAQTLWVFITSLPVILLAASSATVTSIAVSRVDIVIGVVFVAAVLMQAVADQVKLVCYDGTRWMDQSIWFYSRHPNYFCEMVIWDCIFVAATRVLPQRLVPVAAVSPVFVALLLLFVSGIPLLEISADRKFGHLEEYVEYKRTTSAVVPMPKAVYKMIPRVIQKTVLLDFDMYYHIDEKQQMLDNELRSNGYTGQ